jgi:hypothetical protein
MSGLCSKHLYSFDQFFFWGKVWMENENTIVICQILLYKSTIKYAYVQV